jgi:hypothetical protein
MLKYWRIIDSLLWLNRNALIYCCPNKHTKLLLKIQIVTKSGVVIHILVTKPGIDFKPSHNLTICNDHKKNAPQFSFDEMRGV